MLKKWKIILSNWINCYFEDGSQSIYPVTHESLLNIISQLRENFSLDESKSSLLNALTIGDFILEKYPAFKFENGKLEPTSEEEIYIAATLLLFFVCVNSKDVNIKSTMCNKLSAADQETILKFSKCLMQCPQIRSSDVLTAITEACGQDAASAENNNFTVAETPPALRSMHSEMRRLRAALEAERFDRNYLQEELSRTTLKMEKLLKDKEQYKQDIVDLKSKISTCCGQEKETKGTETANDNSTKLLKQLKQTEERLGNVQEQLNDVQYERDTYKNKLDELKKERDKWFSISQEESDRASQLVEELETERRQTHSLRELVIELRQHNRLNGLDSSSLECDDVDTSVQSFVHNTSVCSEACANVIEVQLGEERAKIVALKDQMQKLQDQLNNLQRKSEEETQNFTHIITEKDTDIFNLKHRINEEIEDKNALKSHYENVVTKLNNEVNELEQRLRDTGENSRRIINSKMKEIQILQEEKLSLLQSLSDEITKFESIIQDLKAEIDSEKTSKLKMRDEYEREMMKLKEKVSNRNNELVELQNKIFEKGEMIEDLQGELRKQKDMSNKYLNDVKNLTIQIGDIENNLKGKTDEISEIQNQLQQNIVYSEALNKEINSLRSSLTKAHNESKCLEECNEKLNTEIKNREIKINQIETDVENQRIIFDEEKKKLQYNLDEINATVDALKSQLQNEIQYKISIEDERRDLMEVVSKFEAELSEIKSENTKLDTYLSKEKEECDKLNQLVEELKRDIIKKDSAITLTEELLQKEKARFEEEVRNKESIIISTQNQLLCEKSEKDNFKHDLDEVITEKNALSTVINEKEIIVAELNLKLDNYSKEAEENKMTMKELEKTILQKTQENDELQKNFDVETTKLMIKLNEMDKSLKELRSNSKIIKENKELQIEMLKLDVEKLQTSLQNEHEKTLTIENEKIGLIQQLDQMNAYKNEFEKEYLNKCALLNTMSTELSGEITKANKCINELTHEVEILSKANKDKMEEINNLKFKINQAIDSANEKDSHMNELSNKVEEFQCKLAESKTTVDKKLKIIESLQKENIQLQYTIEEDNSTHEVILKEKDLIIENLEKELQSKISDLENLKKDHENEKFISEKFKIEMRDYINMKDEQINELTDKIHKADKILQENKMVIQTLEVRINSLTDEKTKLTEEIASLIKTCTENGHTSDVLKENLSSEKAARDCIETEKKNLIGENKELTLRIAAIETERDSLLNEKAILVQQLMEERSVLKIADEGKEALLVEKSQLDKQLKELNDTNSILLQEKECLTQQLVEERHSKELAEQEKKNISETKADLEKKLNIEIAARSDLESKNHDLDQQMEIYTKNIENEKSLNTKMKDGINNLKQKVVTLVNENENLASHITNLKKNLDDYKNVEELLRKDKANLLIEKQTLQKSCEELKTEINSKQEEVNKLIEDYDYLKSDYKTLEESNKNINVVLNCGLKKIFDDIKINKCFNNFDKYETFVRGNVKVQDYCDVLNKIINDLSSEVVLKGNLENMLKEKDASVKNVLEMVKDKEKRVSNLEIEVQDLQKIISDCKTELTKQHDRFNTILESKSRELTHLQSENKSLNIELDDLKIQLDVKVHSLKDKLVDNENLTDKLKESYESQIDNLNTMLTKLTNYLKEKTIELDSIRNEKEKLQHAIEEKNKAIKSLEDDLKLQKHKQEKLISEFESERHVLKNMVKVTESVMDDQKNSLNKAIIEHIKSNETLEEEIKTLKAIIDSERINFESDLKEKELKRNTEFEAVLTELNDVRKEKEIKDKDYISRIKVFECKVLSLEESIQEKINTMDALKVENNDLCEKLQKHKEDIILLEEKNNEWKIKKDAIEVEFEGKFKKLDTDLNEQFKRASDLEVTLELKTKENIEIRNKVELLEERIIILAKEKEALESDKTESFNIITALNKNIENIVKENEILKNENEKLLELVKEKNSEITKLQQRLQTDLDHQSEENVKEKINLVNKCCILEEYQTKAETELEKREKEINVLKEELKTLKLKAEQDVCERDRIISQVKEEKDALISNLNEQMKQVQYSLDDLKKQVEIREEDVKILTNKLDERNQQDDVIKKLQKENDELCKAMGGIETFAVVSQEKSCTKYSGQADKNHRDVHQQVDNTPTDTLSIESNKTIGDLEKIIHDKNRTITTLQSDITFMKSLLAESENKLLDVNKDLEIGKENYQQLSSQLKKIVHQKNEEIADLKNKITKMSATENRASQIIKVSAKYQAIILKRIAEIKSNTVLKELTNFGNTNSDNDIRRSLNAGTITMEDLEYFLETTERHLRRCSEKQTALQKERDRLNDINQINESEIISMRKFLTELSVSIKTFNSVRDLYTQKLSRVVSIQRTVRREILSLDGQITDSNMCKLERGYAAVMQDLSECTLNLERWIERFISRTISAEKIKQAFTSDVDRASLVSGSYQNAGWEVQVEELQNSFQKLLEEVVRAQNGEGAKDAQSVTVMEVRAEYEDKLNRMKAKMKQLCQEQIALFKEKHREEVESLEIELKKAHNKLRESSRAYEDHIKSLTTDLWNVGEKFLVKKDEADWLRRRQTSGSLMSLQHVHSSGLAPQPEEPSRPSDTHSLRSLPVTRNNPKEGRTLQMSDEEGEVFDNRCLRELATPRRDDSRRLSELRRRNSLCPPHLKSSYPAETQFAPALHEEDIKCNENMSLGGKQRKEVGITVYKKPGPPTPSKQAGRLSATDSELRQSLRVEADPSACRKTSTPSRIRALFRSAKNETTEGTPRGRRLSNIFRRK